MNSYIKKGSVALIDQVLFSGSNFLLNIYLVKLLAPAEYGLFGSLYSIYLLTTICFIAIFLEPYIYYKNKLNDTEKYTIYHAGFNNSLLIISLFLTFSGCFANQYLLIYLAYILTTCAIYFYKRHYISILAPKHTLYISINYFILVVIGLLLLSFLIPKNIFNAFLVLNIASALSLMPILLSKPLFRTTLYKLNDISAFIEFMKQQKSYAFHCLSSGVLAWIPNNIYFILLPVFFSKEVNAHFKALQNINLPITHLNIAIVSLLVPIFIKSINQEKLIKQISLLFILLPLIYLLVILFVSNMIEHYIYDDKYELQPLLVTALLIGIIPEIIANIYKAYFRSIAKPELVTKVNFINASFAIIGAYFVYRYGIIGVILSYITVNGFNLISSIYFYTLEIKKSPMQDHLTSSV